MELCAIASPFVFCIHVKLKLEPLFVQMKFENFDVEVKMKFEYF